MGSYPISYRGARGPQRGRPAAMPFGPDPTGPAVFLGIAVTAWALDGLVHTLPQFGGLNVRQSPAAYGWTLVTDCGYPPIRLPAAAFTTCGETVMSLSAYNANNSGTNNTLTGINLYYFDRYNRFFSPTAVWVQKSQRWTRGLGAGFANVTPFPRPGILLGGPLMRALGLQEVGYYPPGTRPLPSVPWHPPGTDVLDNRWDIYWPGRPGAVPRPTPDAKPIPRPVARAVPATGMREVKFNANTRAGRMFFAMYSTFNLLGDGLGFTRALWFSIPSEQRGGSMRFRNMAGDIWKNWRHIDPLLMARNLASWKFLDTLYGGTQAAMFNSIAAGYGYPLARAWATLESEINATTGFHRRRLARQQGSDRGG